MPIFTLNLDKVLHPETAVHCKSKEEYDILSELAHNCGLKWSDGSSYIDLDCYSLFDKETCLVFNRGVYCSLLFCKYYYNYTILSFKDAVINNTINDLNLVNKYIKNDLSKRYTQNKEENMYKEDIEYIDKFCEQFTKGIIKKHKCCKKREELINKDDVLNLKIALGTSKSIEEFINIV